MKEKRWETIGSAVLAGLVGALVAIVAQRTSGYANAQDSKPPPARVIEADLVRTTTLELRPEGSQQWVQLVTTPGGGLCINLVSESDEKKVVRRLVFELSGRPIKASGEGGSLSIRDGAGRTVWDTPR